MIKLFAIVFNNNCNKKHNLDGLCQSLSMTVLQNTIPCLVTLRHFRSQHLFLNACWNASFQVKKSITPVAMTITMGAAQMVLRVPKGII